MIIAEEEVTFDRSNPCALDSADEGGNEIVAGDTCA
jgi:hypothetical protein